MGWSTLLGWIVCGGESALPFFLLSKHVSVVELHVDEPSFAKASKVLTTAKKESL